MNPATGDRLTGLNLLFHILHLDPLINLWLTISTLGDGLYRDPRGLAAFWLHDGALSWWHSQYLG